LMQRTIHWETRRCAVWYVMKLKYRSSSSRHYAGTQRD
jgi:hypothetical protein